MHRKKLAALFLLCIMMTSVVSGCMGDRTEEKTTEKTTKAPTTTQPATTLNPGTTTKPPATTVPADQNGNTTEQMLTKIRGIEGITKANALLMGDTVWVWLEHAGSDAAGLKTKVETEIKNGFKDIKDIRIITDETIIGRLEEISQNLKTNGKIEDYKDELNKIK